MKIKPLSKRGYRTFPISCCDNKTCAPIEQPICKCNGTCICERKACPCVYIEGVIEVDESKLSQIGVTLEFDDTLTKLVSLDETDEDRKYKAEQSKQRRLTELKAVLASYSEDFLQVAAGVVIPDIEERKAKFREAHKELRELMGKPAYRGCKGQ